MLNDQIDVPTTCREKGFRLWTPTRNVTENNSPCLRLAGSVQVAGAWHIARSTVREEIESRLKRALKSQEDLDHAEISNMARAVVRAAAAVVSLNSQ